jgi:alcohol dehydrogenase class IV
VIDDTSRSVKMVLVGKTLVPDVALIDPQTLCSMPPELTVATGMDALVHAVEAYVSNAASPFTDIHAKEAIGLVVSNLPASVKDPANLELRSELARASLEAGLAFSNASLGAVHALSHGLGGLFDLPHGECNAQLLGPVVRVNYQAARERYDQVFGFMGMDPAEGSPLEWFEEFLGSFTVGLGLKNGLAMRLPKGETLNQLAEQSLRDACMATNPKKLSLDEIKGIYAKLFLR